MPGGSRNFSVRIMGPFRHGVTPVSGRPLLAAARAVAHVAAERVEHAAAVGTERTIPDRVFPALARFFGLLRSRLKAVGNGALHLCNETIVHANEPLERPSARNLVARLRLSKAAVFMRWSTNRLAVARRGHMSAPARRLSVN
jgi:hypothetical protein